MSLCTCNCWLRPLPGQTTCVWAGDGREHVKPAAFLDASACARSCYLKFKHDAVWGPKQACKIKIKLHTTRRVQGHAQGDSLSNSKTLAAGDPKKHLRFFTKSFGLAGFMLTLRYQRSGIILVKRALLGRCRCLNRSFTSPASSFRPVKATVVRERAAERSFPRDERPSRRRPAQRFKRQDEAAEAPYAPLTGRYSVQNHAYSQALILV